MDKEEMYLEDDLYDLSCGKKGKKKDRKKKRQKRYKKEEKNLYKYDDEEDDKEKYKLTKEQKEELARLYPRELRRKMADELQVYVNIAETYLIFEGVSYKKVKRATELIRKLIRKLKKKKITNIFNYERAIGRGYEDE